jgi:hypothetical protein
MNGGTLFRCAFAAFLTIGCASKKSTIPPEIGDEPIGAPPLAGGGVRGDAGANGPDGGPCNLLMNLGQVVQEVQVGENVPAPSGGALAAGSYNLTAVNLYTGLGGNAGPTGRAFQESVLFGVGTFQDVQAQGAVDAGLMRPITTNGTYTTNGSALTETVTCPGTGAATINYTAIGSTLHLFVSQNEFIYTVQ